MQTHLLKCFDGLSYFDAIISSSVNDGKIELVFKSNNFHFTAEDNFPFYALIKIRLDLEPHNVKILCNGSRVDVYPSGFLMTSFKAYKLVIGEPATGEDLLNILEATSELEMMGTVQEQEKYWQEWLKSSKGEKE
ncbi:hypothetical protein [Chitinophaga sp. OAE865]|uniref:hypothetical protein n=1 Tax=Chitinophaga sp. OAE865 TaxID=2817898 RepID=UPI001AE76124